MKIPFWPDIKNNDINLGLNRIYELLARLDNPHLKLPPTIHIAGTNGKGSTLAFLKAIFSAKKLLVHAYISPHLVNFNERMILSGEEISDEFLNEVLLECKKAAEIEPKISLTFFEATTVAAFLAFSKVRADVLLLETGMGGRLDATNILPQVLCSVITPISFDHQDFLGRTIKEIATEKAGIIKKNCPVIIAKQEPEALEVLKQRAHELHAKTIIFDEDWKIKIEQKRWCYISKISMKLDFPALIGSHQVENASVAIAAALEVALVAFSPGEINSAINSVSHLARLQKITQGKFFDKIPANAELYLDGSHNLQGSTTVLEFLENKKNQKRAVIFSMLKDKDCEGFLKEIAPGLEELIIVPISGESRAMALEEIREIAQKNQIKNVLLANNFDEAFALMDEESKLILICGSLYLAGEFLEANKAS